MIPSGILEGLILAFLAGVGGVAFWGIKRIVYGQDQIHEVLTHISGQISSVRERTVQLETRESMRDQISTRQHEENQRSIELLWKELGKLKETKPRGK